MKVRPSSGMASGSSLVIAILIFLRCSINPTWGHGRLLDPPSRSSMWRMGFRTPKNYNDNELFCGGLTRQQRNGMKCGICGDPYDLKAPRANEMGGRYYSGIISQRYDPEQIIEATVELTANHNGYFEFHVCRVNGNASLETEECLQRNPLEVVGEGRVDAENPYRYYVPRRSTGKYIASLKLPTKFSCDHCVFQWSYTAGNNWGRCEDGRDAVGCGPQETFRGCADIAIGTESGTAQPAVNAMSPTTVGYVAPTARPPPLFSPTVTESWNHWQSDNAWPQSVNPGYPVGTNRTTWFYHQWPTPVRVSKIKETSAPTETVDLKVPQATRFHRHHWLGADNTQKVTNYAGALSHGHPGHHDHSHDLKKFSRWPDARTTSRSPLRNTIPLGNAPSLKDPVRRVGEPATSTSSRPTPQPTHSSQTLPPVVLVETVQNEVLTDPIIVDEPTKTSGKGSCVAAGLYVNVPGMTDWCNQNCFFTPPFCPASHCACA